MLCRRSLKNKNDGEVLKTSIDGKIEERILGHTGYFETSSKKNQNIKTDQSCLTVKTNKKPPCVHV